MMRAALLTVMLLLAGCAPAAPDLAAVTEARAHFMEAERQPYNPERGPYVPGWERQGIDLLALISAAPGGLDANFVVIRSSNRTSLTAYGTAPTLAVPPGWRVLATVADERPGEGLREYSVSFRGDSLVIIAAHRVRRVGTATCVDNNGGAILYATSDGPLSGRDGSAVDSFERMRSFGRGFTLCTVVEQQPGSRLLFRSFDGEGRTIPELDAFTRSDRNTIEPRAPIPSYRRPTPR